MFVEFLLGREALHSTNKLSKTHYRYLTLRCFTLGFFYLKSAIQVIFFLVATIAVTFSGTSAQQIWSH